MMKTMGFTFSFNPYPEARARTISSYGQEDSLTHKRKAEDVPTYAEALSRPYGKANTAHQKSAPEIKKEEAKCLLLQWHEKLGHCSLSRLRHMALENLVMGMPNSKIVAASSMGLKLDCQPCRLGKAVQHHHKASGDSSLPITQPLQLLHLDICGP